MKKLLAMVLALVLALGVTTMAWADGENPDLSGTVVNVTAATAQDVLDGKYGNIDGKTINFTENINSVLVLARPTKHEGSNTVWYNGEWVNNSWTRVDTPVKSVDELTAKVRYYDRTLTNVTFTANSGVTVQGFYAYSGQVSSSGQHDYVVDRDVNGNDQYYGISSLKNITFSGLTITKCVNFDGYETRCRWSVEGLRFENCVFPGNENKTEIAIRVAGAQTVTDMTVTGCTFKNCKEGVLAYSTNGIEIKNNTFESIAAKAIELGSSSNALSGSVTIKENYIKDTNDRAIRLGTFNTGASLVVENNVMVNAKDENGEMFKAEGKPDTISLENNYWGGADAATAVSTKGGVTVPTKTGIVGGTFTVDVTDYMADGMVTVKNADGSYTVVEKVPPRYYYNSTTTTDTKKDDSKSSPKTFDAGVGIYAVSAVLSVTGMAYVGKKKF